MHNSIYPGRLQVNRKNGIVTNCRQQMDLPSYPPAAPIAVVGPQFCSPYPVDLTFTQRFVSVVDPDFSVKDMAGNDVFRVKSMFFSKREKRVLRDAAGEPLITLQAKVLTAHHRWNVFRGNSTDDGDLLFSVKKSHMLQLRNPSLDVSLSLFMTASVCDYKVKGNYFERSCTVYQGDSSVVVAQMKKPHKLTKKVLGKGSFGVTISPNVDQVFIVALITILGEISKDSSGSEDLMAQI